jgi:tRNA threonylcarbamoyl adenosine modification protein (Sua5/YciO/YrdC/YwlC family)
MGTPILTIRMIHPQPRIISRAVSALEQGELIAYPTDTCYGLGCDLMNKQAVKGLFALKRRDRKHPMSVLVTDLSSLAELAKVSNYAYRVIRHLAPGPYTFVLEATSLVPKLMQTRQKTVGIRIPDCPVVSELCRQLGRPLVTTSASENEEPLLGAEDVRNAFGGGLSLVLDGGVVGREFSTVISLVSDELKILRKGKGDVSMLASPN